MTSGNHLYSVITVILGVSLSCNVNDAVQKKSHKISLPGNVTNAVCKMYHITFLQHSVSIPPYETKKVGIKFESSFELIKKYL